jgi:hypothetical protein
MLGRLLQRNISITEYLQLPLKRRVNVSHSEIWPTDVYFIKNDAHACMLSISFHLFAFIDPYWYMTFGYGTCQ